MKIIMTLLLTFGFFIVNAQADIKKIEDHLIKITKTEKYRNYKSIDQLNAIADYIFQNFKKYNNAVSYQSYLVEGNEYKNVIASFGPKDAKRIIVGAHYDVCGDQEGADDNASGVVGLLELARLLQGKTLQYRIDLVAYTLEEPPFFRTEQMGSYIHAQYLNENQIDVFGMISVEMIGYFSEEKNSQTYPIGILSWIYGNRGNYITLVNKLKKGKFARQFSRKYKKQKTIRTKRFGGPTSIPGIDFSDHMNYWEMGYSALMLTDTAFLRNMNYHEKSDQVESLDMHKMAKVIDGLFKTLIQL